MWKTAFKKIWKNMVCLSRPYPFKLFKGCFPQILLGPLFHTLSHVILAKVWTVFSVWRCWLCYVVFNIIKFYFRSLSNIFCHILFKMVAAFEQLLFINKCWYVIFRIVICKIFLCSLYCLNLTMSLLEHGIY